MKCKEIMSHKTTWCKPESTVKQAVELMQKQNCGVIPVADEEGYLQGILTDRDVALFVVSRNKNPEITQLKEFMNKDVITCYDDEELDELISKMKEYKVRRIPIVDRENKLQGMVSLGDVAVKAPQEEHKAFEALEKISQPVHT